MASRVASPLAVCGSMTPSRKRFSRCRSGAIAAAIAADKEANQRRDQVREASIAISKRRAMPPIAPSGNTTPPTRPTGWWRASWRHAGTRRSPTWRRSRAISPRMMRPRGRPPRSRLAHYVGSRSQAIWSAPTTDARLKKRIVRTLIHEAIADIDTGLRDRPGRPLDRRRP